MKCTGCCDERESLEATRLYLQNCEKPFSTFDKVANRTSQFWRYCLFALNDSILCRDLGHSVKCWNQAIQWKKFWSSFLFPLALKIRLWKSLKNGILWISPGRISESSCCQSLSTRVDCDRIQPQLFYEIHSLFFRAPPWINFCPRRNIVFFYLVTHLSGMSQAMAKRKTIIWLTRNILKKRFIFTHQRLSFSNINLFLLFTLIFRLSSAVFPLFFNLSSLNSWVANAILRFVHSSLPAAAYIVLHTPSIFIKDSDSEWINISDRSIAAAAIAVTHLQTTTVA